MSKYILLLSLLVAGCTHKPIGAFKHSNQVSTLGSIHASMLRNPRYTLQDFAAAISLYRPDLILTEVRPRRDGAIEGSIDGGPEQSIVYAVARELNAKVAAADWFDHQFIEAMNREDFSSPKKVVRAQVLRHEYARRVGTESLLQLNGPEVQQKIKAYYSFLDQEGLKLSRQRNEQICMNIRETLARYERSRVLIIFGLDHKFFIDDCVRQIPGQQFMQVGEWLKPEAIAGYRMSPAVRATATDTWLGAEALLSQRLATGFYPHAYATRLKGKVAKYKNWIQAIER